MLGYSLKFNQTFYCYYKPLPLYCHFEVLWSFHFLFSYFCNFNFKILKHIIIFSTSVPSFAIPTVLLPLQLIFNIYKSSLSTSNFALLFFLLFLSFFHTIVSFLFIVFFISWHLALVCFSVCGLFSFVLNWWILFFGFLCSPGQSIVPYFCWTILILLMGVYVYVYIQSHFVLL